MELIYTRPMRQFNEDIGGLYQGIENMENKWHCEYDSVSSGWYSNRRKFEWTSSEDK